MAIGHFDSPLASFYLYLFLSILETKWTANIQPLRQFPCALPGWMVVKDSTLGARQGTLYKVPRNSDRDVKDQNLFAKSDYWNLLACRATAPLPISHWFASRALSDLKVCSLSAPCVCVR